MGELVGIKLYIIVAGLAAVLVGGAFYWSYNKGENAGSSDVKAKVATETVKTLDASRLARERAEQDTRAKPYSERVEGLR
jgi:hypothetical protein